MKLTFTLLLSAVSLAKAMASNGDYAPVNQVESVFVGYFASWGIYSGYTPDKIPANKLTHLNYAFADIVDGEISASDPFADLQKKYGNEPSNATFFGNFYQINKVIKPAHLNLKTLISVGGWSLSKHFSEVASTPQSRSKFTGSCVAFIEKYGFDGIDIDWEYPVAGGLSSNVYSPDDKMNFVYLLDCIRSALDSLPGPKRLLTVAISGNPELYDNIDPYRISLAVDFLNVMAYDFRGPWNKFTGHQANLLAPAQVPEGPEMDGLDNAMFKLVALKVPPSQLVLGVPFYGRGWAGVPNVNHGLYQPFTSIPPGSTPSSGGVYSYKDVAALVASGTYSKYFEAESQSTWAYCASTQIMISYDDTRSMAIKVDQVKGFFRGIMAWDLSSDPNLELVNVIYNGLISASSAGPSSSVTQPVSSSSAAAISSSSLHGVTTTRTASSSSVSATLTTPTSSFQTATIVTSALPVTTFVATSTISSSKSSVSATATISLAPSNATATLASNSSATATISPAPSNATTTSASKSLTTATISLQPSNATATLALNSSATTTISLAPSNATATLALNSSSATHLPSSTSTAPFLTSSTASAAATSVRISTAPPSVSTTATSSSCSAFTPAIFSTNLIVDTDSQQPTAAAVGAATATAACVTTPVAMDSVQTAQLKETNNTVIKCRKKCWQ